MIKSVFMVSTDNKVVGFSLSGHSGMAESGEDILCAAVSGAAQCVITVVEEEIGLTGCFSVQEGEDNLIKCDVSALSGEKAEAAKAVFSGFAKVMEEWEKDFPQNIKVEKFSI